MNVKGNAPVCSLTHLLFPQYAKRMFKMMINGKIITVLESFHARVSMMI